MRGSRVALLVALLAPVAMHGQARTGAAQTDLARLARVEGLHALPVADSVDAGARSVPSGAVVMRSVVARGRVDVAGRVQGDVVSLGGDVVLHPGAVITGDVLSIGGRVLADSGTVQGELRTASALPSLGARGVTPVVARTPAERTLDAVKGVVASFGVLLIVGIGVLLFAGRNLDEVTVTLQSRYARAFWVGVAGQLSVLPLLVVLIAALALTVIGILLIPFAIVAYAVAVAGLLTLGFLAVARLVGDAFARGSSTSERSRALTALAAGLAVFFALWMIGALLAWFPLAATVVRGAALATTWAALTLGLGATILSRAGTHRRMAAEAVRPELAAWQTPTPIGGVVAARRTSTAVTP